MKSVVFAAAVLLAASSTSADIVAFSSRYHLAASGESLLSFTVPEGPSTPVILRAAGPALLNFGVVNAVLNPAIQLFRNNALIGINEDWNLSDAAQFGSVGAFPFAFGSKDAALVVNLAPGTYTLRAFDSDGGAGILMTEAYVADFTSPGFSMIAQTADAGTGVETMMAGFVARDAAYLLRGLGPALGNDGASDPSLTIWGGMSFVGANDNWGTSNPASLVAAAAAVGLMPLDLGSADSALLLHLTTGSYTGILDVFRGQPGRGRIEIANLAYPATSPVPETTGTAGLTAIAILLSVATRRHLRRR